MFLLILFFLTLVALLIYSFGFIDPNLMPFVIPIFAPIIQPLTTLVYKERAWSTVVFGALVLFLFSFYVVAMCKQRDILSVPLKWFFGLTGMLLLLAYPAFSYDIFNYILTAKVTYFYQENPYLVMPIEITNEVTLAFTRAANKVALYGPVWILLTYLPHLFGRGNIWLTLFLFKLTIVMFYFMMLWLIYRITRSWRNVIFFGLNPLVLIEVLVSGHNDIAMMVLAVGGLGLLQRKKKIVQLTGVATFILSIFIKGATAVLVPLAFLTDWPAQKLWKAGYFLMFGVFLLTPLREELYPWYAVWWLTFASLLPIKKNAFIRGFSLAMSFALLLRYFPYIYTREYGGAGPMWRLILTFSLPTLYILWYYHKKIITRFLG